MKQRKTKYTLRSDGRIVMTKTIQGKRVSFYGQTDREVEEKYQAHLRENKKPKDKTVRTFKQAADDWWEEKEPDLSPSSVRVYRARYAEIKSAFGNALVSEITPQLIIAYLRKLQAQGYSQKVINSKKSIIKSILDNALIAGEIPTNPCINLPTIKGKPKVQRQSATADDIKAIEAHRGDSNISRMIFFLLLTGCRRGEAAALQWKHIDIDKQTAHIQQTLVYSSPTPQIKASPKTDAGIRDVFLPKPLIESLPPYTKPEGYVFFPHGLPKEREFQVLIDSCREAIGMSCTLHQLRHYYATMLHAAGVDAKDAQHLLGHSSIVVTQDIYTEIDKNAQKQSTKLIEEYVQKNVLLSKALSEPSMPHESSV